MIRIDNWSHWEDESITEVIMEYAKQKKKAGDAFEYLSNILPSRTAAAVRFRWYNYVKPTLLKAQAKEPVQEAAPQIAPLTLDAYVQLLTAINLTPETIELINLRIRSLI